MLCHISEYSVTSGALFKYKMRYLMVSGLERIHYLCENGIENLPLAIIVCTNSASLVMLNGYPGDSFFLSHPHTHDRFLQPLLSKHLLCLHGNICCGYSLDASHEMLPTNISTYVLV